MVCSPSDAGSDLAVIITSASWIEVYLERILGKCFHDFGIAKFFLVNLNFRTKIDIAYQCELITERFKNDLHEIRKIRNMYAHIEYMMGATWWGDPDVQKGVKNVVKDFSQLFHQFPEIVKIYQKTFKDILKAKFRFVLRMLDYYFQLYSRLKLKERPEPFYVDNFKSTLIEMEMKENLI